VTAASVKFKPALGFLTVVEDPRAGLFGGYLLLNPAGRPLEFHCTAPIKPNRAQQILYGPTLEPFLFGEQIGQTLIQKARIEPQVLCADREPALAVREFVNMPVVLVLPEDGPAEAPGSSHTEPPSPGESPEGAYRIDAAHDSPLLIGFRLGRNRLAVPDSDPGAAERITERLAKLCDGLDLAEPFQRIREAIAEARRGGQ
jgi:hypothetical protein